MTEVLQFAVLGLGAGAIYVLLAQGVIAVYRGSGVINFAAGAQAMLGAYLFIELREGQAWGVGAAIAGAAIVTAVIGAAVHVGIMRPLRHASPLTRTVATLGVFIVLQGFAQLNWGVVIRFASPFLPQDIVTVGDITIGADRLWLLGIACVVTAVMWGVSRFTRFGLATSAVAESERTAAAMGWSPDLIATVNWAIGGALAGLAGSLIVPLTGVQFATTSLLIIPALAVCLLGNFSSFPITLVAGLLLGIAESEVGRYVTTQGATKSIPFFVIVIVLMVRGRALPLRSHLQDRLPRLGSGRTRWGIVLAGTAVTAGLIFAVNGTYVTAITVTLCWALMMLSVVVLTGYTGQLSLAQLALAGIGAFAAAKLVASEGWPFELAIPAGIVCAIVVGALFALPALRTRGANLAVITMGLGLALYLMVFTNTEYTGSGSGLRVGAMTLFGLDVDAVNHPERYALVVLAALLIAMYVVSVLRRSQAGRALVATRMNERAAASVGVNVLTTKTYAFAVSAGLAGLGGILLAFQSGTVGLVRFDPFSSIQLVAFTVIGGVGYIVGPLLGTAFVPGGVTQQLFGEALGSITDSIGDYIVLIGGLGLLATVLQSPDGIAADFLGKGRRGTERTEKREHEAVAAVMREINDVAPTASSIPSRTLVIRDLTVRFGNVEAVSHLDLDLSPGRITGLIGPNGAGKTTLVDAVTGYVKPATGSIRLDGTTIDRWKPYRRARAGIARSFQGLELFEDLSVLENLQCAVDQRGVGAYVSSLVRADHAAHSDVITTVISDFGLADDLARRPTELPYGRRRLVAIARAAATNSSILLLDEPAAGLSGTEISELGVLIERLARTRNMSVLVIEHDVDFVMSICDEVAVLDFGRLIAHSSPDVVRHDHAVRAAYLGEEVEVEVASP
jgi:ABC-type branched-subunit amino acid transport system ATPase component/branched-subunit amino acid ABC-type transport system permease component